MDFGRGKMRVLEHKRDVQVLGREFRKRPLPAVSSRLDGGWSGIWSYQIDDLVMAGRQEIASVIMESLGTVKRQYRVLFPGTRTTLSRSYE